MSHPDSSAPAFTQRYPNLASAKLGARPVSATDEWFAPVERMLSDAPAVFIDGKFDDHGKWMDGWETRRKRAEGNDHCVIRLALPGIVRGVDIDTRHFTGNFPPAAALDGCFVAAGDPDADAAWFPLVAPTSLGGNAQHFVAVDEPRVVSHVRLSIYPDGGVARLRVYGQVVADWSGAGAELTELSAMRLGGRIVACNNSHFGPPHAMLAAGRGVNMGDGWETRRRREPGNDWAIIELGHPGVIERVEIDTAHFKGNFPDAASLQAAYVRAGTDQSVITQAMFWAELLPAQKLSADAIHTFSAELKALGAVTHVRLNIFPDGGVSRLRLFGRAQRG